MDKPPLSVTVRVTTMTGYEGKALTQHQLGALMALLTWITDNPSE
ncbi:hypothetical protein [Streptacidiphilus sp. MAP5-3]